MTANITGRAAPESPFMTRNADLLNLFRLAGKNVPTEDSEMGRAVSILTTIIDQHSHSIPDASEDREELIDALRGWSVFNGNAACNPYAESHDGKRVDGDNMFEVVGKACQLAGVEVAHCEFFDALDELEDKIGEDDFTLDFDGAEYRLIKSDEDVIWPIYRDAIQSTVEECYSEVLDLSKIPAFIAVSVDWEQTAKNAYADGYGHHFSGYDGSENDAAGYYIFRTN